MEGWSVLQNIAELCMMRDSESEQPVDSIFVASKFKINYCNISCSATSADDQALAAVRTVYKGKENAYSYCY